MIEAGQPVRLKPTVTHTCPEGRENNETAVVRGSLKSDIPGGLIMDRDLKGCRYWNEDDVEVVTSH